MLLDMLPLNRRARLFFQAKPQRDLLAKRRLTATTTTYGRSSPHNLIQIGTLLLDVNSLLYPYEVHVTINCALPVCG
jgi:hypothetical protein